MTKIRTAGSAEVTDLILEIFRLYGRLLAAGDALVEDLGLSSARWQVLGAVAAEASPLPVAGLARRIGLTRQAVQRVANDLEAIGLVAFEPNPEHQRAKLVVLTASGRATYDAAEQRQIPWANGLARDLQVSDIQTALQTVRTLAARLDQP